MLGALYDDVSGQTALRKRERYRLIHLIHCALPEPDLSFIETRTKLLGRTLRALCRS